MCRLGNIAMRDYQESVTDRQTDRQTDVRQSDILYVPLCFTGDTKSNFVFLVTDNLVLINVHASLLYMVIWISFIQTN